jgi:DnaJ-class molecular chaperone
MSERDLILREEMNNDFLNMGSVEPEACHECEGTGECGDSGEGFWEYDKCPRCGGTGYEPEGMTDD